MPALTPAGYSSTFSAAAFRQWEKVIHQAVEQFPTPVLVQCEHRRPDTVCSRIRDAARGYWTHNYSSYVNRIDFSERWPLITVTPAANNQVIIGDKTHFSTPTTVEQALSGTKAASLDVTFNCTTLDQLKSFLFLADSSCFNSTPVKLTGLTLPCTNFLLNGTYQLTYPNTFVDVLSANEAIIL
jgi:hypothetical protein